MSLVVQGFIGRDSSANETLFRLSTEKEREFQAGLSKLNFFLQNTLSNESLSSEADVHKQECVTLVEGMISSLNNMKNSNMKEDNHLNNGLSVSSQSLDETYDLSGIADQGIPRSGSLPDMSNYMQPEDLGNWQASKTKKGSYYADFDHEEINLNDLRQLVIYHPTEEEEDTSDNNEDDVHHHNTLNTSNELNTSNCSPVNKRKSRKRDSAALFDISLEDLTEPDFAGLLREKHSEKLWWCVLIDQHLCIFPSQDPEEVAYDVIIMPCCQISLDDRLMRTPVFRLTQSDMAPWVFVASNNDELKEWMKVLTFAASAGKHSSVAPSNTNEKKLSAPPQAPLMQSILEEEEEEEELDEFAEASLSSSFKSDANHLSSQSFKKCSELNESDNNLPVGYVNGESVKNGYEKKELPKRPDEVDGEKFVEDPYEDVANQKRAEENFQDDGFATDEFDSASSDGGDVSTIPQTQPVQKAKKTKQFFKWLKKKAKKGKLFSSPEDGVALAGYAFKSNDSSKRWFLIREQKLLCFKTIKDEDPEITVDLNGSEIKVGEEEKAKLAIQVIRDGTNHFTLVAKTLKDWERWKKAFLIESGFIQLAVSLTDTSSGFYDQEEDGEEGEYVTPIASPVSEKTPTPTSNTFPLNKNNETDDEDLYMEVVPSTVTTVEKLKSPSPSSSLLELGPLPPLPPDLPPRNTPDGAEGDGNEESCQITWESEEIYEEVSSSVANADKVIKWQGLNSKKIEVCPTGIQGKRSDKSAKGPVPAGVSDGAIEDSAITASSFLDNSSKPSAGRLNSSVGAWCAKGNDKQQYLQIDLGEVDKVCGVASQGKPGFLDQGGWFVKTYTLAYSKNGENWANYKEFGIAKVFQGNSDPDTVVTNMLKMAVNARYVRIKPQSWHNHIAMRVEVYKGEASSKLTAGIHKLADTLTKTTKKKTADRQRATSSPVEIEEEDDYSAGKPTLERNDSFDEKVKYINRPSSKENLLDGDEERDKENQVTGVDNEAVTNEEELAADDYLQLVREPTEEEKQVELKVQQRIEAGRKGEQIGRYEVSQGIKARKSLYENNQQSETTQDQRRDSVSKAPKETEVVTKKQKYIVEKKEVEEEKTENKAKDKKERNSSNSSQRDPDREREELEKTEKAFQNYAKQLKEEGGPVVKEKRASIVALNRLNFEDPRSASKAKENGTYPEKMESLLKEKEELLKKMENLRKRLSVAKDRKIFFSLSTSRSKATTDADAEFHESQNEMTKTKKRLMEIENETKNLKVMELRYQKTPEKTNPEKPLRKNSRECKLGSVEVQSSRMAISSPSSGKDKEKELSQTGSVLSQIKAFEQMKKK